MGPKTNEGTCSSTVPGRFAPTSSIDADFQHDEPADSDHLLSMTTITRYYSSLFNALSFSPLSSTTKYIDITTTTESH